MKQLLSIAFLFLFSSVSSFAGGTTDICTYRIDGQKRSYVFYRPEGLPADAPLVFVLHGYGGKARPEDYDMNRTADRYGFAVCYPQGAEDLRGNPCWNVGYPFQKGLKTDDVRFLCRLAGHLQKKYRLSRRNTFCTGISNGGEMCYLLAYGGCKTFSALAPVAGLTLEWMYRKFDGCPRPVPLLEIHGTEDRISEWTGDLEDKGGWGSYLPVPVAVNFWAAANRCVREEVDTLPRKGEKSRTVVAHRYVGGTGGKETWLYEIVGGSHSWGSEDLNTGEEIWRFFSKYVK